MINFASAIGVTNLPRSDRYHGMPASKESDSTKKRGNEIHQVSTRAQIERLYGIVAKVQNNEAVNLTALAMAFEVNNRTIQRDIEFLRDRLGVPITFERTENRYFIDDDFAHIPPLELKETDYLLLSFLQQCLAPYAATEIGAEMNKSFERLFGVLSGSKKWKEWSKAVLFRFENQPQGIPKEVKLFNVLYRAISQQKEVKFSYKALRKPSTEKVVKPLLMMMKKGRWYLYGVSESRKGITPFSFNRISDIEITKEKFSADRLPNPRAMLHHSFGAVISSDPPFDVVLEFESKVVERMKETIWHPDQKLEVLPEGRARLTLPLNNTMEVESWILSWGPYVKVIEPKKLAQSVRESGNRISELYYLHG